MGVGLVRCHQCLEASRSRPVTEVQVNRAVGQGWLVGSPVAAPIRGDEVHAAVRIEITRCNAVPPTSQVRQGHTGVGLGGAMPNATALASEFVPSSKRPFAITLIIVCIPIGAMIAAFLSGQIIPAFGWRVFFLGGGIAPIALGALLFATLPESPRFLAQQRKRWPELIKMLNRLGHDVSSNAQFTISSNKPDSPPTSSGNSILRLFSSEFRRDTTALCVAFFFCLLVIYLALQLLVTVLKESGFNALLASRVLGWWNFGGIAGAIVGAVIIQRLGSKITLLSLSGLSVFVAFVVASMKLDPISWLTLMLICVALSGAINAVQVALYALAAHAYPTEIRGRGIGFVLTVGRLGNISAAYIGMAVLDLGGASAYFATIGMGMAVVLAALAIIRRHI